MEEFRRCDVCGSSTHAEELMEAEIIGRMRTVCRDCHGHLEDIW